ncbi:MAG: ATP synthase F0 subunit A [Phycisphaeraceae bacterium]|nr:MAG: ATP synthase F0 subunit A [Phycisphaeraceae bacterium]
MLDLSLTLAADGPNPLGHVLDVPNVLGPFSMHVVTLVLAAVLTILTMMKVAKAMEEGSEADGAGRYIPKGKLAQIIEFLCSTLRDKVVKPQLGDSTDKFMPFLWTLFFFILFNNMLGLIPLLDLQHVIGGVGWGDKHWAIVGGTATGNLAVTAGLATIAFFVIQINGIRSSGFGGWANHFLGGAPVWLAPVIVPVEILGMIIKPSALAIRLCANMVGGHTLLATVLMFTGMSIGAIGWLAGAPVAILSMLGGIAIYFLEIFVGALQAFIFMFLTTIFIAQLMHHHHDDHEGAHDYGHDQVPESQDLAVPVTQ